MNPVPKVMLSAPDIFGVVESVWSTSLGLTTEFVATSSRSRRHWSSVDQSFEEGWTACVWISGGWDGAIVLNCSPELARMGAVSMFNVDPEMVTQEDARDALAEMANIVGGNLKALLPDACETSTPIMGSPNLLDDLARNGKCVGRMLARCLGWKFSVSLIEMAGSARPLNVRRLS